MILNYFNNFIILCGGEIKVKKMIIFLKFMCYFYYLNVLKLFYPLMFTHGTSTSKQSILKLSYIAKLHVKDYGGFFSKT